MQKMFISGPMTGIEDYNFPLFNYVENFYIKMGYKVVNPVNICKKYKREKVLADANVFNLMVQEELDELKTCDMIVMLPGWKKSKGALKEHEIAKENNLKIYGAI